LRAQAVSGKNYNLNQLTIINKQAHKNHNPKENNKIVRKEYKNEEHK
jgi:hypothetical protein